MRGAEVRPTDYSHKRLGARMRAAGPKTELVFPKEINNLVVPRSQRRLRAHGRGRMYGTLPA